MARPFADADRSLFWTLAIAAFIAAAVGLAARAVDRIAAAYEAQAGNYAIVRVIAPEAPAGLPLAQAALADAPHVARATPMTAAHAAALLRQWGGATLAPGDMPALQLIEVELAPAPPGVDVGQDIVAALAQGGVTAEFTRAPETESSGGIAARARVGALWGGCLFAVVMALIISLAARGLATRRRELMQVLADMGATRGQAGARVANEAAAKGFVAGIVGALLAGLVGAGLVLLIMPGASLQTLRGLIGPIDLIPLALTPFGVAVAAAMGARAGAESLYAQAASLA